MAKSTESTVKIKIDLPNIDKTLASLKTLATSSSDLASGAKNQISMIEKLAQSVRSGSKVSDKQINSIYSGLKEYNNELSLSIQKYNKDLNETINTINTLEKDIDELTKKQKNQKISYAKSQAKNQTSSVFTKTQSVYAKGSHTQQEIDIANSFTTYQDTYNLSKKGMEKATPEEQARIKVAREIIELYKTQKQKAQESEKAHKEALDETNKALNAKKALLKEANEQKAELEKNPVPTATTVNTGLNQTINELGRAKYDMQAAGVTSAEIVSPDRWKNTGRNIMKTGVALQFLRRAARASVQAVQELDKAITDMTVVTGESREETEKYVESFVKIARASSSTITEIAGLTTEYVRQGRSMKDAMILAEETAKAAKIAGISTSESLTYMTSAINGFNLAAKDAAHVSDVFAKIAAETATDYEQLAVALSKVSAQASQAGMSLEYTTALLAKGIETTQEAPESIGTALKTIVARFRELSDYGSTLEDGMSVNQVEEALKAVGIAARDQAGNFRDLDDILNELGPRWDSLTSMQRQAIAQAAAGTRQQSRFLAIMQDWDRTMQIVNKSQTAAGASAAQYSKYAKGLEASITNMKSSWQDFVTTMTDSNMISGIVDIASSFLNTASGFLKLFDKVGPYAIAVIGAITAARKLGAKADAKNLAAVQQEIGLRMQLNDKEYERYQTLQSRAEQEVLLAQNHLENTKQQEIKDRAAEIDTQIVREQMFKERLENIDLEDEAKANAAKAELERLASIAEAENDTARASKIREMAGQVDVDRAEVRKKINQQIAESEKNLNELTQKRQAIEQKVNESYAAREQSLAKLAKDTKRWGAGLTATFNSLGRNVKNLFSKQGLKSLASAGATAIMTTAVTFAIQAIDDMRNLTENTLSNIAEISAAIHDNSSKAASVAELAAEYDKLSKSINKTAEEEARLKEIEEEMKTTHGKEVNSLQDFEEQIDKYNVEVAKGTEEAMVEAFKISLIKGKNMFEDEEFDATIKLRLKSLNEADTSTAQGKFQYEQYEDVVENVNTNEMAGAILDNYQSSANAGNIGYGILSGVGAVGAAGGAAVGLAMLAAGSATIPVAGWIVAGVAALGAAVAAVWATVKANSSKVAKEAATEIAEQTAAIAREVNEFAEGMSKVYDQDLASQYEQYSALVDKYSDITKEAIKESNKGFELIRNMGLTASEIKKLQGVNITDGIWTATFSNEEMNALIKQAGELGEEAGQAFITEWTNLTNQGLSKQEIASNLLTSLTSSDTNLGRTALASAKQNKKEAETNKENAQKELDIFYNMRFDKYLEENKAYKGMSYSEVESKLKAAVDRNVEAYNKAGQAVDDLTYTLLETISSFDTLQELGQGLTSINSAMKNANDFADRLAEGTTTIEDWTMAATSYSSLLSSDEWKKASNTERANMIRLQSNAFTAEKQRVEMIDNFILRAQTENTKALEALQERWEAGDIKTKEEYEAQVKALNDNTDATISAAEEMKQLADTLTSKDVNDIVYNKLLSDADKKISEDNLTGFSDKINLLDNEMSRINSSMNDNWNQWETDAKNSDYMDEFDKQEWRQIMDDLLSGDKTSYERWSRTASSGAKTAFKIIWNTYSADKDKYQELLDLKTETTKSYTEKQIDIQQQAIEVYKEKLNEEKEALKESLDKRKELYDKYFDALEEQDSDEEFADKQFRLQQAIAALSTATDSQSLALKKQYQEELAELEKDQLAEERDRRREATTTTLDNLEEQMNQYYEERLNNEQMLWQELSKLSSEELTTLYTTYNEEYKKSTDLNKAYLLESFKSIIYGVQSMTGVSIPGYSTGGLVDYTGIAAVHGTTSKPEAFLNSSQTELFSKLAANLETYYKMPSFYNNDHGTNSINVENITIAIDAQLNDNNISQTGESLADALLQGLRRTGISVNMKK